MTVHVQQPNFSHPNWLWCSLMLVWPWGQNIYRLIIRQCIFPENGPIKVNICWHKCLHSAFRFIELNKYINFFTNSNSILVWLQTTALWLEVEKESQPCMLTLLWLSKSFPSHSYLTVYYNNDIASCLQLLKLSMKGFNLQLKQNCYLYSYCIYITQTRAQYPLIFNKRKGLQLEKSTNALVCLLLRIRLLLLLLFPAAERLYQIKSCDWAVSHRHQRLSEKWPNQHQGNAQIRRRQVFIYLLLVIVRNRL